MSPSFDDRTKYTPLWETWCDTCDEGVSPDHTGTRCAYCGTITRRNWHANRDHPNRYPTIPNANALFEAARKAHDAGIPIAEFARSALPLTGRTSAGSLAHTIRSEFYRRNWPMRDAAEAGRLGKRRYKMRLELGERPPGLCVDTNRHGAPCKRHATRGSAYCNLHDPVRRERARAVYAGNVLAAREHTISSSWSEYAPRLREWFDAYGHGARTAAARRGGTNTQVFDGLLLFERQGVDRPITRRVAECLDRVLATPPVRLESDGLKRGRRVIPVEPSGVKR